VRYAAPHTRNRGEKCAGLANFSDRIIDDRCIDGEWARSRSRQVDPAGAKFDHNGLHDGLQFSGGDLPKLLRGAFLIDRRRGQYHGKRVMSEQLFEPATGLSDDLRARFTIPVVRVQPEAGLLMQASESRV
jgi:hypothetical protein